MKPTKTLIEALYSAADRIEFGTDYNWSCVERCNCGILAQELLGVDDRTLYDRFPSSLSWQSSVERSVHFCQTTQLPVSAIFQELYRHGLEQADFKQIENAGLIAGTDCCDMDDLIALVEQRQNPVFVANFFRQLAEKLQTERKMKA